MKMTLDWQIIVLILIVLLLVILWLLLHQARINFPKKVVDRLQANRPPLHPVTNWTDISEPNAQGVRSTVGTYAMSNSAGSIILNLYGKQMDAMQSFIEEAQFYFAPTAEKPPKELLALLSGLFGRRVSAATKSYLASTLSGESQAPDGSEFETEEDLFVDFEFAPGAEGAGVQTIEFMIDPRLKNNQSKTHRATINGIYVSIHASIGTVACTLKQKNNVMGNGNAGTCVLSTPVANEKRDHSLKVKGTAIDNYYTLSGNWWNVS